MADHFVPFADKFVEWRGFLAHADNIPLPRPGAYRLLHVANGKSYVGISQNVEHRLGRHAAGMSPPKFRNAIRKYGKEAFVIEPLYYLAGSDTTMALLAIEAALIVEFDSVDRGYNIQTSSRGIGPYGPAFSEIMRASWEAPERRARRRETDADPAFRARHSEAVRAAMAIPEIAARMVAASQAKAADPDFRARVAKTLREVHARPDSPFAPYYADSEFQARRIAAGIEAKEKPDIREKIINMPAKSNSVLGVRGVGLTKNGRRFRAYIKEKGKLINLGHFDTIEEARAAYCIAARRIHGDLFKG